MRLSNVDTGRMTGLKYKLICHFKLAVDMVRYDIRVQRLEFFGVNGYKQPRACRAERRVA